MKLAEALQIDLEPEPLVPRGVYPAEFCLQESIHTAIALQAYLDESVRKMDASPHSKTLGAAVFYAASALRKVKGF